MAALLPSASPSASSTGAASSTMVGMQSTFAWIKPDAVALGHVTLIQTRIKLEGFEIVREGKLQMTMEQARQFYAEHVERPFWPALSSFITSGTAVAMELRAVNAVVKWRSLMGPTDTAVAKQSDPSSIRAVCGTDKTRNAVHGSDSAISAARELELVFGTFVPNLQHTFAWIKPDAVAAGYTDAILKRIKEERFEVVQQQRMRLTEENVRSFYAEHVGKEFFPGLIAFMTSGPVVALSLRKRDAITAWRALAGPTDSIVAKRDQPNSLRSLFGSDKTRNAIHGSDSVASAERETSLVFTTFLQTTFAWIKPDAVAAGHTDAIITRIKKDGFEIVKQHKLQLTDDHVKAFYAEHVTKDFFADLSTFMTSGPAVALALRRETAVRFWRDICGPTDPVEAKKTKPHCLRSIYGTDKTHNAVHSSDSKDSAAREIELVFNHFLPTPLQTTFAWIKPNAVAHADAIISRIEADGFEVVRRVKMRLNDEQVGQFYAEHVGKPFFPALAASMLAGWVVGLALRKENAITSWRKLCGPTDSLFAKQTYPNCLRSIYGEDNTRNAVHGSDSPESAEREIGLVFGQFAVGVQTTFAFIKPDAVAKRHISAIITRAQAEGFEVIKREVITLDMQQAMRFYVAHAGQGFFVDLLQYVTSGPMVALALRKENAIREWRTLAGPTDASVAKRTHPNTLRALYGSDATRNAVHGSDSVESAARELDLVFNTFSVGVQTTFAWIKPDAVAADKVDAIIQRIQSEGFEVVKRARGTLTADNIASFYAEHVGRPFFPALAASMTSGPVVALALRKENAIREWRELMGPTDATIAKRQAPHSLRAQFGTDKTRNATHGSDSVDSAARELDLVFNYIFVGVQTTYAMIKPGVSKEARQAIIARIKEEKFEIVNEADFQMTVPQAQVFYAEHAGRPFYSGLVTMMTSGRVLGLALRRDGAIRAWRALAGPTDSEEAKRSAPHSIRALYGVDKTRNAVHGSDSEESAARELRLVFSTFAVNILTTCAMIKPDIVDKHEDTIMKIIAAEKFEVVARRSVRLTYDQARAYYAGHSNRNYFLALLDYITSGPLIILALRRDHAVQAWINLCGPSTPSPTRNPQCLRAVFGTDGLKNGLHCSESLADANRELAMFFPDANLHVGQSVAP